MYISCHWLSIFHDVLERAIIAENNTEMDDVTINHVHSGGVSCILL